MDKLCFGLRSDIGMGSPEHGFSGRTPTVSAAQIPRKKAPEDFYNLKNPLEATPENLKKGKMLYQVRAKPMPCKHCHGVTGDGRGPMSVGFNPPPRDFTCTKTIKGVPDGQLFWIIKNGSPGTGMLVYKRLKDEQIWQILLYVRQLAKE